MLRCSRCKCVPYCSRECKAAAWPSHKGACAKRSELKKQLDSKARAGCAALSTASTRPDLKHAAELCTHAADLAAELRESLADGLGDFPRWWPLELEVAAAVGNGGEQRLWHAESEMRRCTSTARMRLGDFGGAKAAATAARVCAEHSGDVARQVDAMVSEGCALLNGGMLDRASASLKGAIELSERATRRAAGGGGGGAGAGAGSGAGARGAGAGSGAGARVAGAALLAAEAAARSNLSRVLVSQGDTRAAAEQMRLAVSNRRSAWDDAQEAARAGTDALAGHCDLAGAARQLGSTLINHAGVLCAAEDEGNEGGSNEGGSSGGNEAAARAAYEEALAIARRFGDAHLE